MAFISKEQLLQHWADFIERGVPHASIRLGDGEACVAAHDEILTMECVRRVYSWVDDVKYCGVTLPNASVRNQLIDAYRQADFIGLMHQTEWWGFKPLTDLILAYHGIAPQQTFYHFDIFNLCKTRMFYDYFRDKEILLVGGKSQAYREVLERRYGFSRIVGTVNCPSWEGIEQAKREISAIPHRVTFLSAGVPAKILAIHSKHLGHVAIDLGQGADVCIGSDFYGYDVWDNTTWNAP